MGSSWPHLFGRLDPQGVGALGLDFGAFSRHCADLVGPVKHLLWELFYSCLKRSLDFTDFSHLSNTCCGTSLTVFDFQAPTSTQTDELEYHHRSTRPATVARTGVSHRILGRSSNGFSGGFTGCRRWEPQVRPVAHEVHGPVLRGKSGEGNAGGSPGKRWSLGPSFNEI